MSDQTPSLIPIDPSTQSPEPPKKNHNALKHGLFIQGYHLHNLNPVEKAELFDTRDLIEAFKKEMSHLYEVSINSKDIFEVNFSMRTMANAAMALTRLLSAQEDHSAFTLHNEYCPSKHEPPTRHSFIKGLIKNIEDIVDLSDLKARVEQDDENYREELAASSNLSPEHE